MQDSFHEEMERLQQEYREQREALLGVQDQLSEVQAEKTSADGAVTAFVGPSGELTGLKLHADKHRSMTGDRLASLVLETIAKARADAMRQVQELMPTSPFGDISFEDIMEPGFDWGSLLPGEVPAPPPLPSSRRTGDDRPGAV